VTLFDYKFHHPVNNFKNINMRGSSTEHEFGSIFIEYFADFSDNKDIAIRELPVPGSGIADFVVIKNAHANNEKLETRVQSFEFKMKDWRKGLMQAHRYRYFSNSAILVIPTKTLIIAQKAIELFKLLDVGLWSFDVGSGSIIKKFTPRPQKALDKNREGYVLKMVFERP